MEGVHTKYIFPKSDMHLSLKFTLQLNFILCFLKYLFCEESEQIEVIIWDYLLGLAAVLRTTALRTTALRTTALRTTVFP